MPDWDDPFASNREQGSVVGAFESDGKSAPVASNRWSGRVDRGWAIIRVSLLASRCWARPDFGGCEPSV